MNISVKNSTIQTNESTTAVVAPARDAQPSTEYLKHNTGGQFLIRELNLPVAALLQGPSPYAD